MNFFSGRRQIVFIVVVIIAGAVGVGLINYYGVGGSHHHGSLVVAIALVVLVAVGNYIRYRMRQSGRDPVYNAGRQLREMRHDQLGEGGAPLPPGQAPRVVEPEPEPRRRG